MHMAQIRYHSRSAMVAYQDLLCQLADADAASFPGTLEERRRNGRTYLYERFRIGSTMKARHIGEDSPALRARIAQVRLLRGREKKRAAERTRFVRVLRAEGYGRVDSETGAILNAFARTGFSGLAGRSWGRMPACSMRADWA